MSWLCKAAVPCMPPSSTIINRSSIQAIRPSAPLLDYATSKGAIVNFTKGPPADLVGKVRGRLSGPGPSRRRKLDLCLRRCPP